MRVSGLLIWITCALISVSGWKTGKDDASEHTEPKYFHEVNQHFLHYDARFSKKPLSNVEQRETIRFLLQSYLTVMQDLGVETWLMHGTLLGWWWGKKIMPWDVDADVQVTEGDIYFLAAYYNMTTYYFENKKEEGSGRFYLLDINPHFVHREADDKRNLIDGRWIDTSTGLFIDITAARYDLDHPEGEGIMYDKNRHTYRDTYIFPLNKTTFEGVSAKVPFGHIELLEAEYGPDALDNDLFNGHEYDRKKQEWIPIDPYDLV